jgi:hypothetical protein
MAHTPGPWGIVFHGDVERIRLNGSTVYQVSDVTDPEFPSGTPRYNLDDLRLMAAAPHLLDVLRDAKAELIWLYEEVYPDDESDNGTTAVIDKVIAAIAKAEGRVP